MCRRTNELASGVESHVGAVREYCCLCPVQVWNLGGGEISAMAIDITGATAIAGADNVSVCISTQAIPGGFECSVAIFKHRLLGDQAP